MLLERDIPTGIEKLKLQKKNLSFGNKQSNTINKKIKISYSIQSGQTANDSSC